MDFASDTEFWEVTWKFEGEAFETLRAMAQEITYPAQENVFAAGDLADGMYLVLEGFALVLVTDPETGLDQTVGVVGPDQSFGELGLLVNRPRLATVAAGTPLRVLKITAETLSTLESEAPRIAAVLYKKLSRTLAEQLITKGRLVQAPQGAD